MVSVSYLKCNRVDIRFLWMGFSNNTTNKKRNAQALKKPPSPLSHIATQWHTHSQCDTTTLISVSLGPDIWAVFTWYCLDFNLKNIGRYNQRGLSVYKFLNFLVSCEYFSKIIGWFYLWIKLNPVLLDTILLVVIYIRFAYTSLSLVSRDFLDFFVVCYSVMSWN